MNPSPASVPSSTPSPCTGVCVLDPGTSLCIGCLRTSEEILAWLGLTEEGRREVLRRVEVRRGAASSSPTAASGRGESGKPDDRDESST